jgi:hypothetical protein
MKIAYLTSEQQDAVLNHHNTEYSIFSVFQDDSTSQYYITEFDVINTNVPEFLWVKYLELSDLPEHEYYKFKIPQP